ncbi:hypothetical protein ACWCPQ_34220 [Nocardia sp. NPDC001965]
MTTTLKNVAARIERAIDVQADGALTLATTYAARFGYAAMPASGQAPDAEVTAEEADTIVGAAVAGAACDFDTETTHLDEIADMAGVIEEAVSERDVRIRRAYSDGVRLGLIAQAAGMQPHQVRDVLDRTSTQRRISGHLR